MRFFSKGRCSDLYDDEVGKSVRNNCLVIGDSSEDIDREFGMVFLNLGRGPKDREGYAGRFRSDAFEIGMIIEELLLSGDGNFAQGFDNLFLQGVKHDIFRRVRFSMKRQEYTGPIGCRVEREIHSSNSYCSGLERFPIEQLFSREF